MPDDGRLVARHEQVALNAGVVCDKDASSECPCPGDKAAAQGSRDALHADAAAPGPAAVPTHADPPASALDAYADACVVAPHGRLSAAGPPGHSIAAAVVLPVHAACRRTAGIPLRAVAARARVGAPHGRLGAAGASGHS